MDVGLFYFADAGAGPDRYRLLIEGARLGDRLGLRALWTPERHFHPFGGVYPNPAVTGAAVAAVTERIEIRAGSVVAPLHHPARIAEEWAVVDNLSRGRAGISFASGWHPTDFALRPEAYAQRRRAVADAVRTVRRLWRGEATELTDGEGSRVEVVTYPRPVRSDLPIWLTSAGNVETFRLAGELRAGVLTHLLGQDIDDLAGKIGEYRRALAARPDADGWPGHVVIMLHTFVGDTTDEVRALVREPFCQYLASSFTLFAGAITGDPSFDATKLTRQDIDFLVNRSFDRFFATSGLFGTVDDARGTVDRLRAIGVDEVACLIDFGVDPDLVLASLPRLADLTSPARVARR
jgi:natural product biosynthesis luciferase-like monooxygenase protein